MEVYCIPYRCRLSRRACASRRLRPRLPPGEPDAFAHCHDCDTGWDCVQQQPPGSLGPRGEVRLAQTAAQRCSFPGCPTVREQTIVGQSPWCGRHRHPGWRRQDLAQLRLQELPELAFIVLIVCPAPDEEPIGPKRLGEACGIVPGQAGTWCWRWLKLLVERGLISRHGHGLYRRTAAGNDLVGGCIDC